MTCVADYAVTGLVFLNNRYHDPQLGVFISVDPMVSSTGEPYIYASGNPATLSDPTGLDPCPGSGCSWTDSGGRSRCARSEGTGRLTCQDGFVSGNGATDLRRASPRSEAFNKYTEWGNQWHGMCWILHCRTVPTWVPRAVQPDAASNADLLAELIRLDRVLNGSLDEFRVSWENAEAQPALDWTNNGCSDRGFATNANFGCIRHDFLYRNQRRIDTQYQLGGRLRQNSDAFKAMVDAAFGGDIGGWRGVVAHAGVWAAGDGFHDEWVAEEWKAATASSVYGNSPYRVTPTLAGVDRDVSDYFLRPRNLIAAG